MTPAETPAPTAPARMPTLADLLRRRAALIAVAVLLGASGCASQRGGVAAAVPSPSPSVALTNKEAAVRDAATMLAAFRPPRGAQRLPGQPAGTADVWPSTGGTAGNVADDTSWWKLPGSSSTAALAAVPVPDGATAGDTWNSNGPGGASYGKEWNWPPVAGQLVDRHIEVNTARVGTATILRVDAIAVWVPPRPAGSLVPADVPVLVVTYNPPGIGPTQSTPLGPRTITDAGEVAAVVAEVNAAPVEPYGPRPCPAGIGRMDLSFRSAGGSEEAKAQVDIGGCDDIYVTVGSVDATLSGGAKLVGQVLATLHLPWPKPSD